MSRNHDFKQDAFLQRLHRFIRKESLFHDRQPLLLAISGGLDSMVLSHMLCALHYEIHLAHCNFGLRGADSDADEAFVSEWARQLGCPCHITRFDTMEYVGRHKVSVQEAARTLRYTWLAEQIEVLSASDPSRRFRLLTAHHLDDNIETMLHHFFRGTGVSGMRGMLPSTPLVARPLLFTGREELLAYARSVGLKWREDLSNQEDKYNRNFLRLNVLPLLATRFPGVRENLAAKLNRFRELEALSEKALAPVMRKLVQQEGPDGWRIPVKGLQLTGFSETILWNVLKDLGFTAGQLRDVAGLLVGSSGRWVASETHRVLRHRDWLLIHPVNPETAPIFILENTEGSIGFPAGRIEWKCIDRPMSEIPQTNEMVWLDLADIRFPLTLRRWSKGDYFYPQGLGKKKKIARFLIDEKMSLQAKQQVWLLESDRRVLWVVGKRIDHRFRVEPSSNRILQVRFYKE
jgi:tRNA(Ile)-lysidine synthase